MLVNVNILSFAIHIIIIYIGRYIRIIGNAKFRELMTKGQN